jgi:hypothetical protein
MKSTAHPLRRAVLLAVSVACVFGLVSPALALDDTKPAPACSDLAFKDPAGDQVRGFTGTPVDPSVGPNMDVIGGFFKDDAGEVTANLQISNLSNDIPPGASAISWYVVWTVGSTDYFVAATVASGAQPAYEHGTYDASLGQFSSVGASKGKFFPGDHGVIQIVIPAAAKGSEGQILKSPYAYAYENISIPGVGSLLNQDDRAPDTGNGKSYEVAQCAAGSTPPTGTTPPVSTTPPGTLPITLASSKAKAAKAKKGKSLSLKLKSTEQVTGITATLKKGSTTYGTGKLASLNGSGTLKVKLKKAMKKGTYKLQLKGSTAAGAGKATFSVKAS